MKLFTVLAAVALATAVGCTTSPTHKETISPSVSVSAPRKTIMTGESTRVVAHTTDCANSSPVKWTISPSVGKISGEMQSGETAIFTTDQPGSYIIRAAVQRPDGTWVTSRDVSITVHGQKYMATEKP